MLVSHKIRELKTVQMAACLYVFFIPFDQRLATIFLLLWLFVSLLGSHMNSWNKSAPLLLLPLLFGIYAISLGMSENSSIGFLTRKLSLLVFPLIFFVKKYETAERKRIAVFFIWGLVGASIACIVVAFYRSLHLVDGHLFFKPNVLEGRGFFESILYGGNYFFGSHFSVFHQTVYFSMYLLTGIVVLLYQSLGLKKRIRCVLVLFFIGIIFLISNKGGILVLGIVFFIRLLTLDLGKSKKLAILVLLILGLAVVGYSNPRFRTSIKKVANGELQLDGKARYDYKTRLLSWDAAITLIKESPWFGYGIGDAQNELDRIYAEKEYKEPLKEQLNAHSQFLQIWIETGIIGVMIFCSILFMPLVLIPTESEIWGVVFSLVIILTVNSMFESILSRFSGISFFSFVCCILFSGYKERRAVS